MTKIVEYSSKATAVRGAKRAGATDALVKTSVFERDGKWVVDMANIQHELEKAARGTAEVVVLSDHDRQELANELKLRGITPAATVAPVSNDAAAQMSQAEIDEDLAATCGHSHCPACGIHLSNGLMDFDSLADQHGEKEAYALQKHNWSCMGCNAEWGDEIEAPTKAKKPAKVNEGPARIYTNRSTVDGACAVVWQLADSMPGAKRKEVIGAAVDAGVAFYTARTQYQKWYKTQGK
jgi:hypothetical protein